jgi:hypothetical protein
MDREKIIVIFLLGVMGVLAVLSMADTSATSDEVPHIVAGYSYLTLQDYRLNPEHPPLIKDLAALPLLFLDLNFPSNDYAWTEYVNGQWRLGLLFLYEYGNNPDVMLFLSRIPMVIVLISLGLFLFYWTKKLVGSIPALFILALFSFSPTFLAHGRLVTTDVAATFGVVLSTYFFLQFLEKFSVKNSILFGITLAFALLVKFSAVILVPYFLILAIIYLWLQPSHQRSLFYKYMLGGCIIGIVVIFLVGIIYQFHIINYSAEQQIQDSEETLAYYLSIDRDAISYEIAGNSVLRPYAHYLMGLLRSVGRVQQKSIEYFLGELGLTGWWYYFPIVYLFKVPLAFHVMSLFALFGAIFRMQHIPWRKWLKNHFIEFSMILFVVLYGVTAVMTSMNMGIRHILPIFPFLYILVVLGLKPYIKTFPVLFLLGWYVISSLSVFPHYLAYYNELAGGSKRGYKISVNSNYDWGQDYKRLGHWVKEENIAKIYVDVGTRGEWAAKYYLGDRHIAWKGSSWWERVYGVRDFPEDFPKGNYLAVSASLLQGGGWVGDPPWIRDYAWLDEHEPIARVGRSIFVYYID